MHMGINEFSAKEAINMLSALELEKILSFLVKKMRQKKLPIKIIISRKKKEIDTQGLVKLIEKTKRKKNFKIHSATKIFQALRIFVNKEISELLNGLISASKILKNMAF